VGSMVELIIIGSVSMMTPQSFKAF